MAEITPYHFVPPNLIGEGDVRPLLGLGQDRPSPYLPIDRTPKEIKRIDRIYRSSKGDNEMLSHVLKWGMDGRPYPAPLQIPFAGAELRQAAVRELVENTDLFVGLEHLLRTQEIFNRRGGDRALHYAISPEKAKSYLDNIAALGNTGAQAEAWQRAIAWARQMREDTLFLEVYREKRKATDARLFVVFSERYNGVRTGLLRPGVNPDDVFDFLHADVTTHEQMKKRKRRLAPEKREIIKYRNAGDEDAILHIAERARQRIDIMNEISSDMALYPLLLTHAQLHDYYSAAVFTKRFAASGPVAFPTWGDSLALKEVAPIRLVLEQFVRPPERELFRADIVTGRLANIEGANATGKTETLRTVHLAYQLANMGAALPAAAAQLPASPGVTFVHGNKGVNYQGSEYQTIVSSMLTELRYVRPNALVLLDEFGDATNAPTALETAKRLIPALLDHGCTVLSTTQHGAISDFITKTGGQNFTLENYHLTPSDGTLDYKSQQTLDTLGFTEEAIRTALGEQRVSTEVEEEDDGFEPDHDLPF